MVDLLWGAVGERGEAEQKLAAWDVCMDEIERCHRESQVRSHRTLQPAGPC